jgi:hypothetical protein
MYCLELASDTPSGCQGYYSLCIRQPYTIGRLESCDIVLNEQDVSRIHASLQVVRTANLEYSYSRGGASPFRPPVGHSDAPLISHQDDEPELPLSLVVSNQSKFGTSVDGVTVSGSCVIPHGGIVVFGSVGFRVTYRPLIVTISPTSYDPNHRAELEDMITQLGAFVPSRPGEESAFVNSVEDAAERRTLSSLQQFQLQCAQLTPGQQTAAASTTSFHTTWTASAGQSPTGRGEEFPVAHRGLRLRHAPGKFSRARPLGALHLTDLIDASDTTVDALLHGHSLVLPAFVFELFAALADQCDKPLHKLPRPADFEPPKVTEVYSGTPYIRPEPRSVPFTLFSQASDPSKLPQTSRVTLLQHRMFTINNDALRDKLAPVLQTCGAVVVPWSDALDYTNYDIRGDDDPNEIVYDDADFADAAGVRSSATKLASSPDFKRKRAVLLRYRDRRYAIATRGELVALRDEDILTAPPPDAPAADHHIYTRVQGLRADWVTMAKNGWCVISHDCVLRALLGNKFVPMPELPTDATQYNDNLTPSRDGSSSDEDVLGSPLATQLFKTTADTRDRDDVDSDATPSDLGSHDGPVRAALRRLADDPATAPTTKDVASTTVTSAARTLHNPQRFPGASVSVDSWVASQSVASSATARSAQAFDIRLHRLQVVVDRTLSVCKARVEEIVRHYQASNPADGHVHFNAPGRSKTVPPPATAVGFLRNVMEKAQNHLQELEKLSSDPEGGSRALNIQGQWDVCAALEHRAQEGLDAILNTKQKGHRHAAASYRTRTPPQFRGHTTAADQHILPARDEVASSGAFRSRSATSSRASVASASTRVHSLATSQRSLAGSVAVGAAATRSADSALATPATESNVGLRDRTRWARFLPAAPVQAISTPHSSSGGDNAQKKVHSALLVRISPMDLPRISRHRRLFVTKFGPQEGEVRFNMWLTSQTPQWSAAFFQALEQAEQTLQDFVRNSA